MVVKVNPAAKELFEHACQAMFDKNLIGKMRTNPGGLPYYFKRLHGLAELSGQIVPQNVIEQMGVLKITYPREMGIVKKKVKPKAKLAIKKLRRLK